MPSTSNSFVIGLNRERDQSFSYEFYNPRMKRSPLNPLSIFSQIIEEIPTRKLLRFIRFSFDSRKTKTLNIIYKDEDCSEEKCCWNLTTCYWLVAVCSRVRIWIMIQNDGTTYF